MRKTILVASMIFFSWVLTAVCAETSPDANPPGSSWSGVPATELEPRCGHSDEILAYLVSKMNTGGVFNGTTATKGKFQLKATQGESGRMMYVYPDNTWVIILDYFSSPETLDVSCLVATGTPSDMEAAVKLKVKNLPGTPDGMSEFRGDLHNEKVRHILRKNEYRVDI